MKLPKVEDYLQALQQAPNQLFTDDELLQGKIEVNALGMPRTRSGNFALVFRMFTGERGYAVRCFTRLAQESDRRQREISKALASVTQSLGARSPFLTFEFQASGIRVGGAWHPLVKMAWCEGKTMGEFVSEHYKSRQHMSALRKSLADLNGLLSQYGIAHGDIQPSNILVLQQGQLLKLIDYDGCYVPALKGLPASELGHVNFQHPKRAEQHFDATLDHFSFQLLDLSLHLLELDPTLWDKTYSDEEGFIFRAHDLSNPASSKAFLLASKTPGMAESCQKLARICLGSYEANVPSGDRVLQSPMVFNPPASSNQSQIQTAKALEQIYLSSHPILSATQFQQISHHVAQRIELIGKVVEIRTGKRSFGGKPALRPYVYIDFSPISGGKVTRAKILPEVLEAQHFTPQTLPNDRWVGKWVSINEVVQPLCSVVHPAFPAGLSELSLHVQHPNQLRLIPEEEARFRLAGGQQQAQRQGMTPSVTRQPPSPSPAPPQAPPSRPPPRKNRNATILDRIRSSL